VALQDLAFPSIAGHGLTQRDYFAAAALASAMTQLGKTPSDDDVRLVAENCYHIADAMLAARRDK